jgi:membrane protein
MKYCGQMGRAFAAAGRQMLNYEVSRDASGISYFSFLALFPAVLVLIGLVDSFLGWMNLHGVVIQRAAALFPGSRQFFRANLNQLTSPSTAIVLSCILVVLWSSSWIFTFMENAINRAWGVPHQKSFWESRLRTFAFMLLGGASLLTSSILTLFVSSVRTRASASMPNSVKVSYFIGWFWYFLLLTTGLLIAILVFALVFKLVPHCKVKWSEAFCGAVTSTILWEIGSVIFAKLVPIFDYQRIYGRMGVVIALLTWVYTSSLIMLFGANFSAQLHAMDVSDISSSIIPQEEQERKIRRFPLRKY